MKAETLIEVASKSAERCFAETGELIPMFHYVRSDGHHVVIAAPFRNHHEKMLCMDYMRKLLAAEQASAVVSICEAWVAFAKTDEEARAIGGRVHDHPDRREVVTFMAEDSSGVATGQREIVRPLGAKPYLGPLTVERPQHMEGNMVGLLPKGALQ